MVLTGRRQLTNKQSDMAATPGKTDPKKKGKGPWMTDTEEKLEEAIRIGVRSSGKAETRVHRVEFYLEQLARAKVQVAFYEEMVRLEEQRAGVAERYQPECAALEAELRLLTLQDQVGRLRRGGQAVGVTDDDERTVVADLSGRVPARGEQQWQHV
jgi:hypothetical protein